MLDGQRGALDEHRYGEIKMLGKKIAGLLALSMMPSMANATSYVLQFSGYVSNSTALFQNNGGSTTIDDPSFGYVKNGDAFSGKITFDDLGAVDTHSPFFQTWYLLAQPITINIMAGSYVWSETLGPGNANIPNWLTGASIILQDRTGGFSYQYDEQRFIVNRDPDTYGSKVGSPVDLSGGIAAGKGVASEYLSFRETSFDGVRSSTALSELDDPGRFINAAYYSYSISDGHETNLYTFDSHILSASLTSLSDASAVPEPATWAMFIGGFGLIGGRLRRGKVAVSFA